MSIVSQMLLLQFITLARVPERPVRAGRVRYRKVRDKCLMPPALPGGKEKEVLQHSKVQHSSISKQWDCNSKLECCNIRYSLKNNVEQSIYYCKTKTTSQEKLKKPQKIVMLLCKCKCTATLLVSDRTSNIEISYANFRCIRVVHHTHIPH